MTKKVIAIAVSEVFANLVMTRFKLNRRLACPNLPCKIVGRNSRMIAVPGAYFSRYLAVSA
jgi:hypothetical protein